jgi:hypothetical protein
MKLFSRLLATAFLLLMLHVPVSARRAQADVQQYAYITYDTPETATIWLVHPSSLETTVLTTISANPGETIGAAFLSPANDWIVVRFTSEQTASLRLISLSSGETANIINGFAFPLRPNSIASDFDVFEWSPNGQYFAFFTQAGDEGQTLYVYNVQTRTLTNIGTPGENQYQLSWSPNGDQVAFASFGCVVSGCAGASLIVYDMTTMAVEHAIDLAPFATNIDTESRNLCEIHWSTDAASISFLDYCDSSGLGAPREIQVVDLASEIITQATSLTPTDVPPANSIFNATLDTTWATNNALLMGIHVVTGEILTSSGTDTTYTALYEFQNRSISVIDSRRLGQWTRGNDQLFAYLAYIYSRNSNNDSILTDASVEMSSFNGQSLTPLASGPSGCLLSWNRNANTVAYVGLNVAAVKFCEPRFETLHFLTSTQLQSFVLDQSQRAAALGWYSGSSA